jgi:hypothetical protein
VLARFMELRGRRVIESCGVLWHEERGFLMSCPYELRLDPDSRGLKHLLRSTRAAGARFSSLAWPGLPGGTYLFVGNQYGLASLHADFRRKVRRGMERLQVRPMESSELLIQGLQLNLDTMDRQGRRDSEFGEEKNWKRFVDAVRRSAGVSAVGAFQSDRLAAYAILCREGRGLYIQHQMSRAADLNYYPNHVLTYQITRGAAEDDSLDFVSYGLGSPERAPGLHVFKSRMGYGFHGQNSVIRLHPGLAPFARPASMLIDAVRKLRPQDRRWDQLATVVRGIRLSKE